MERLSRILIEAGEVTLTVQFFDDGLSVDVGVVTVTVVDSTGEEIASGAAGKDVEAGEVTYTFGLPAQSQPDQLTVNWTAGSRVARTITDVVATRLLAPYQILDREPKFSSKPILDIEAAIVAVEDLFEQVAGVSFSHRFDRFTLSGATRRALWLPRPQLQTLRKVVEDGVDITADVLGESSGRLTRISQIAWSGTAPGNVTVSVEHGYENPPGPVSREAVTFAIALIAGSDVLNRATIHTDDTGTYRLAVPDSHQHPTGIPSVDAVLGRYTNPVVMA